MRKNKTAAAASREDVFVRLTLIQLAAAAILGGLFFGACKLNGDLFAELKNGYNALMAEDKDLNELIPYNYLRETTAVFESGSETEEPAEDAAAGSDEDSTSRLRSPEVISPPAENGAGGADEPEDGGTPVSAEAPEGLSAVMPVNGTYTSYFGNRIHPVYGTQGFHSGIDIAAPEGSPVYAALDGEVTDCGVGEMSGNYIKLDNGGGVETLYCHLSEVTAQKGQSVRRGDIIALVGQTGLATGPHLHFELHLDGVKCDPAGLLENAVVVS